MRPLPALGLPFHCLPLACLFTAFPWPAFSLPFLGLPFHCLSLTFHRPFTAYRYNLAALLHPDSDAEPEAEAAGGAAGADGEAGCCNVDWVGLGGYPAAVVGGGAAGGGGDGGSPHLTPADRVRVAREIADGMW